MEAWNTLEAQGFRVRPCGYPLCPGHGHLIAVCPTMHRVCDHCGFRGHNAPSRSSYSINESGNYGYKVCGRAGDGTQERLREVFERHADLGVYTRMRRSIGRFGFYPVPGAAEDHFKHENYDRLQRLPVVRAVQKIGE